MSIKTTHWVNREEATAILDDKRRAKGKDIKSYQYKTNSWLGDKLDKVINNCFYNFIVVESEAESNYSSINRYTVPDECE